MACLDCNISLSLTPVSGERGVGQEGEERVKREEMGGEVEHVEGKEGDNWEEERLGEGKGGIDGPRYEGRGGERKQGPEGPNPYLQ